MGPESADDDRSLFWYEGSPGDPAENAQTVTFIVNNDNPGLFVAPPAVASSGPGTYPDSGLTFTLVPGASGIANVSVIAQDNGGGSPNMVFATITHDDPAAFADHMLANEVIVRVGGNSSRMVTHLDVDADDVRHVIKAAAAYQGS